MKIGEARRMPTSACTGCGKRVDGATCVGTDAKPGPGDFTVCIYCGHIMAFGKNLRLRRLTSREMHEIAGDKRILAIQRARAMVEGDEK